MLLFADQVFDFLLLYQGFSLAIEKAEIFTSRLKEWNLLDPNSKISV